MQVDIISWNAHSSWALGKSSIVTKNKAQLVIFFAAPEFYLNNIGTEFLRTTYPNAKIVGCSTGGEILGSEALDGTVVACAIEFEKTRIEIASVDLKEGCTSHEAGKKLAKNLLKYDLKHIYIVSDGTKVNGSDLVKGLFAELPPHVIVTGGLAGDGANFGKTYVTVNDHSADQQIAAIGLYGDAIQIGYGSMGGWDAFGPERIITKSKGNILYELDHKPALELYKSYLGDEAKDLPGSGLLFPLKIREHEASKHEIVRTIVGINEEEQSLIFAGDVSEGYMARLMKGNFNNLVEGAMQAASKSQVNNEAAPGLALSVSCIGRKLLMGQRISDETEVIDEVFQGKTPIIGFYSYGEICHHYFTNKCDLHNQTMTITYINEAV